MKKLLAAAILATVLWVDQPETTVLATPSSVPTTTVFTYQNVHDVGWVSRGESECWQAISEFRPLADRLRVPMVCQTTLPWDANGVFDGVVRVLASDDTDPAYYKLVASHELGHAWDQYVLSEPGKREAALEALKWPEWDVEGWAKVFQYAIGWWVPEDHYGDTMPLAAQIEALRAAHLVP